ncbi:MAG: BatA domain-containing protein [Thermonemataceae bacterium]
MSFVYPQFLWALFVVAIPILIHLFNFRRIKKVYFTNVRFLKAIKTETNAVRTLKELLILLMRVLFFTALVLAFAQPFLPSDNSQQGLQANSVVSIYLDNSYSMQNELDNKPYLNWAIEAVTDLVNIFPQAASFQLITNDFENKEQFVNNASKIEDRLTEMQFSNKHRTFDIIHNRQQSLLQRVKQVAQNQLFWFSDFQKSTAGALEKIALDSANQYYLVPIKTQDNQNVAIDSVWLSNPFIKENETNTINFMAHNYGTEAYEDLSFKLFIDYIQVSTATLSIAADGTTSGSFNFTVQGKGLKKCRITFEDYPIVFDNEYFFTVEVAPVIRILHLYEEQRHSYIQRVFDSEASFKATHYSTKNLDYSAIAASDLVVINEVDRLDGELKTQLQTFVKNGGSLAIFPPPQPDATSYTTFLGGLGIRGLQVVKSDSLQKTVAKTLQAPNIDQPFFKGIFEKIPTNLYMPYANASLRWINTGFPLLQFKSGATFATENTVGRGHLYLFAAPLARTHSDFALNAIFVPIMYKIASLSKQQGNRLAYTFQDKNIVLEVEENPSGQIYELTKDELTFIPAQRQAGEQLFLELPQDALEAGYYTLTLEDKPVSTLAFNYGKEESAMAFYTEEELKELFGNRKHVHIYESLTDKAFVSAFKEQNIGTPLWKYFVWAALFFVLAEIAIIRFFK